MDRKFISMFMISVSKHQQNLFQLFHILGHTKRKWCDVIGQLTLSNAQNTMIGSWFDSYTAEKLTAEHEFLQC